MCYYVAHEIDRDPRTATARQSLAALVAEGETFTVTDRGRPVALLSPLREAGWDDLTGSGRLTLPIAEVADIDPLPGDGSSILSEALEDLRRDER